MTMQETVSSEILFENYLDPATLPYAFCPGCSHGRILDQINAALVRLQIDPHSVVIVTDIGCVGISDKYFATHAFHGLHGRSVTYATGIKLANPDLKVIVLIGDGGCGIGGHHLLNAARRNIGVTVLVFNNLNYGMTGGQYSATTPVGSITSTTPHGHLERPLDIAGTVAVNGAGFVARTTAFDPDLPDLIAQAITYDGFSLLDIWELCTAYYVPRNDFSRRALEETMTRLDYETGIIDRKPFDTPSAAQDTRPEYSQAYRAVSADLHGQPVRQPPSLPTLFGSRLDHPMRLIIGGAAGQRVKTAGTLLATGGVLAGLWATRRDDYPVTVQSGHSISEVVLSPTPIHYTGIQQPDVVALLAPEGAQRLRNRLAGMDPTGTVYLADRLDAVETSAQTVAFDFPPEARRHVRKSLSTLAVGRLVQALDLYPLEALREAIRRTQRPAIAEINIAALDTITP
jgi:pyruvate/2-oxoacid:ferredoxin oxidoreductase beta subunit/Pyruvate/2-oxoacid:ferredoxin oxidoreductase gamma subunit